MSPLRRGGKAVLRPARICRPVVRGASVRHVLGARLRHAAHDAQAQRDQHGDADVGGGYVHGDQCPGKAADENDATDQVESEGHGGSPCVS